ncbi:MAG: hypothetical protein IPJ07_13260 [Acidobacteria bacterium]|nr:hypothetical protein [Acidobacteriota bacterium]
MNLNNITNKKGVFMLRNWLGVLIFLVSIGVSNVAAQGSAVVTDGKFTNIYVFPNPSSETWEQHMARLRPTDAAQFSRAAIDRFTEELMAPVWPSYFDPLFQYSGIRPPRFFGSAVASQACVDAAMRDLHNGVMQWDTIRSLSNCHIDGHDPSPQVILIFSPDIKIGKIVPFGTSGDMCTTSTTRGWHAWGLNTPNFIAIPTNAACTPTFTDITKIISHEVAETISDPGGFGFGNLGKDEVADKCEGSPDGPTFWRGFTVERYWSNFDNNCQPRLEPSVGAVAETWLLGQGSPLQRFTGDVHTLTLPVPPRRTTSNARLTQVLLVTQTGGDDLRGGSNDNADVTLNFVGGSQLTTNINAGRQWNNGQTHAVRLRLPINPLRVSDLTGITITTRFRGGFDGDNWNLDKAALIVSFPAGSTTSSTTPPVVHNWLDASGAPLVRFTGDIHDRVLAVPRIDPGRQVLELNLIISTGNDDLRGGGNSGDNCDITILLTGNRRIVLNNVNQGRTLGNWSEHIVKIPLPSGGIRGGDVTGVQLHTGFGGGLGETIGTCSVFNLKPLSDNRLPQIDAHLYKRRQHRTSVQP